MKQISIILTGLIFWLVSDINAQEFKLQQQIVPDTLFDNCGFSVVAFNDNYALAQQNVYYVNDTVNIPYVVYKKQNGTWQKLSDIIIPNSLVSSCAKFGESISMTDDYLAIGAPKLYCVVNNSLYMNGVYVYRLNDQGMSAAVRIADPDSAMGYIHFGDQVHVSNTTLAVAGRVAYANEDQSVTYSYPGSVYIFQLNDEKEWKYTQRIDWPVRDDDTPALFGTSICTTDDWLFVSAPGWPEYQDTATVFIYARDSEGQYNLHQKVKTPWHTYGSGVGYRFYGNLMDATDSVLAVYDKFPCDTIRENTFYYEGAVHIYMLEDGVWQKTQTLISEDVRINEGYRHFSLDGNYLGLVNTVSAEVNGVFDYVSKVSVFEKKENEFVFKQAVFPPDHEQYDNFGNTFHIYNNQLFINNTSRDTVVDEMRYSNVGKVYVYTNSLSHNDTGNTKIEYTDFPPKVKMYPNPAGQYLQFSLSKLRHADLCIRNIYGQTVLKTQIENMQQLNIGFLGSGYYLVSLTTGDFNFNTLLLKL
jgi:hypothetical protein